MNYTDNLIIIAQPCYNQVTSKLSAPEVEVLKAGKMGKHKDLSKCHIMMRTES